MDNLNEQLTNEFLKAAGGEGETITFSSEENKECIERYTQLYDNDEKMEEVVRKEKVRSASAPAVYLTF